MRHHDIPGFSIPLAGRASLGGMTGSAYPGISRDLCPSAGRYTVALIWDSCDDLDPLRSPDGLSFFSCGDLGGFSIGVTGGFGLSRAGVDRLVFFNSGDGVAADLDSEICLDCCLRAGVRDGGAGVAPREKEERGLVGFLGVGAAMRGVSGSDEDPSDIMEGS